MDDILIDRNPFLVNFKNKILNTFIENSHYFNSKILHRTKSLEEFSFFVENPHLLDIKFYNWKNIDLIIDDKEYNIMDALDYVLNYRTEKTLKKLVFENYRMQFRNYHCYEPIYIYTLVVWKLDRLGRSLAHLISIITSLKNRNISFISITEGMDTTTASGELFFHIFGALAQFERSLIQERVKAGLESAKQRGISGGRPRAIDDEKINAIKKALDDGMSKAAICRTFGVKRSTLIDSLNRT
jgi:hypothetical protein